MRFLFGPHFLCAVTISILYSLAGYNILYRLAFSMAIKYKTLAGDFLKQFVWATNEQGCLNYDFFDQNDLYDGSLILAPYTSSFMSRLF